MGLLRWVASHLVSVVLIAVLAGAAVFRHELAAEFGLGNQLAALEAQVGSFWPVSQTPAMKVRQAAPEVVKPIAVVEQKSGWERFWPTGSETPSVRVRTAEAPAAAPSPAPQPQVRPAPPAVPVPAAGMSGMYGMSGMSGMSGTTAQAPKPAAVPAAPAPAAAPAPMAAPAPAAAPAQAADLRQGWMQARRAYAMGDLAGAVAAYEALVFQFPAEADVMGELGNLYMLQGRQADAANAFYEAGQRLLAGPNKVRAQALVPMLNQIDRAKGEALRNQIYQAMQAGR